MSVRPVVDTLRELRDGRFLEDLSVDLNDLVRQVQATDKKGQLTITIDVNPVNGDATSVTLTDTIKVKTPTLKRATLFFTTPEANLSRRDPRQPDIPGLTVASGREDDEEYTFNDSQETDTA